MGDDFHLIAARDKASGDVYVRDGGAHAEVAGRTGLVLVFVDEEHALVLVGDVEAQVRALYAKDVMRGEDKLAALLPCLVLADKLRYLGQDGPADTIDAPGAAVLHLLRGILLEGADDLEAVVARSRREALVQPVGSSVRLQVDERERELHVVAKPDEVPDAVVEHREHGAGVRLGNRRVVADDFLYQLFRAEVLIGDAPVAEVLLAGLELVLVSSNCYHSFSFGLAARFRCVLMPE